jgi:hypothetical protein
VRHALWLIVLIKLMTPPVVHWPWALPNPTAGFRASRSVPPEPIPSHPMDPEANPNSLLG